MKEGMNKIVIIDDIAWLNVGPDERLWAINPEAGFFGVAPGTSMKTNPNMMRTLKKDGFCPTIFTNTALDTDTNSPWWEGIDGARPKNLLDWQGKAYLPSSGTKAAHPNSRFTVSMYNAPTLSKEVDNPKGVPISAMIFGGKRTQLIPLVFESFNWQNGVFAAARMGSETTAAAAHQVGVLRRDPMAMLPFCGYSMGDYFKHWLNIGKRMKNPPKIFCVNWFRQDDSGKFMWPGFGDNIRVLEWVIKRVKGGVQGHKTPIGIIPRLEELNLTGLDINEETMKKLFEIKPDAWKSELEDVKIFLRQFADTMPEEMWQEYKNLEAQLS